MNIAWSKVVWVLPQQIISDTNQEKIIEKLKLCESGDYPTLKDLFLHLHFS